MNNFGDHEAYHLKQLELMQEDIARSIEEMNKLERWIGLASGGAVVFFIANAESYRLNNWLLLFALVLPLIGFLKYLFLYQRNVAIHSESMKIERQYGEIGINSALEKWAGKA